MSNKESEPDFLEGLEEGPSSDGPEEFPADYSVRLNSLLEQKVIAISMYYSIVNEIKGMADGGNADGIREKFYKGWTNKHLTTLLEELGEK